MANNPLTYIQRQPKNVFAQLKPGFMKLIHLQLKPVSSIPAATSSATIVRSLMMRLNGCMSNFLSLRSFLASRLMDYCLVPLMMLLNA